MEASETELINALSPTHGELRHLVQQHHGFEKELERLERIRFPSEAERREISKLKRMKLRGKDRIQSILSAHRQA
jgi:hypothetical protein